GLPASVGRSLAKKIESSSPERRPSQSAQGVALIPGTGAGGLNGRARQPASAPVAASELASPATPVSAPPSVAATGASSPTQAARMGPAPARTATAVSVFQFTSGSLPRSHFARRARRLARPPPVCAMERAHVAEAEDVGDLFDRVGASREELLGE